MDARTTPQATPLLIGRARSADAIAAALQQQLERAGFGPAADDPLRAALVRIAARQGEILTECINAAADAHLAAFADLLAAGPRRAAAAAEVHLVFKAAPGSAPVVVPMHTRVAATAQQGDTEPVVFETCEDLDLVRADLQQAWHADAGHHQLRDVAALLSPRGLAGSAPVQAVARACHFAWRDDVAAVAGLRELRLQVAIAGPAAVDSAGWRLDWTLATAQGEQALVVRSDTSAQLTRDGEIVLALPADWKVTRIAGVEARWLSARLRPPPQTTDGVAGAAPVLRLRTLQAVVHAATAPQPLQAACHGVIPLDTSKAFFPFGERPRFGEVACLLSPAFGEAGAHVELDVDMVNARDAAAAPVRAVSSSGKPVLAWEISSRGGGWRRLAVDDGTQALTQGGRLSFSVPEDVAATTLAGTSGVWLRALLVSGDYGGSLDDPKNPPRSPVLRGVTVQSLLRRGPLPLERVVREGALECAVLALAAGHDFDLVPPPDVAGPVLYLALGMAGTKSPPALASGCRLALLVRPREPAEPVLLDDTAGAVTPRWQLRGADGWVDLAVRDGTRGLTRAGTVQLRLPCAAAAWRDSSLDGGGQRAWLRAVWPAGLAASALALLPRGLALNAVAARHSQQLRDEIVGSSNGRPAQVFAVLRRPVIGPVQLQVRELEDAWVPWQEVDTLQASAAGERHFTLDRPSGALRFGDGHRGRIPPPGANNVRLHRYATGGGRAGNRPALSLNQLRSAIPAVESVHNPDPASGGIDAQDDADRHAQASAWLRHRDRAVCADDYADLALQATPEIARAWCVAGRDLAAAHMPGADAAEAEPGVLSVIVLPQSNAERPQPSLALLALVKRHLDARRAPVGRLLLTGPRYAGVAVRVEIGVDAAASPHRVAAACQLLIQRFLHPLTGGNDGRGWPPGRRPHRSDIVALVAAVEGVSVVRSTALQVAAGDGGPCIVAAGAIEVLTEAAP